MQQVKAMLMGKAIHSVDDLKRQFPERKDRVFLARELGLRGNASDRMIFANLPFAHAMDNGLRPEPCGRDDLSVNTGSFMRGHSESLNSRGDVDDEDLWPTIANFLKGGTPLLQQLFMGLAVLLGLYLTWYALSFGYAVFVAVYAFFTSKTTLIALASLVVAILVMRCPDEHRKTMRYIVTVFVLPLVCQLCGISNSGQPPSNALNVATSASQVVSGAAAAKFAMHGPSLPVVNNYNTNVIRDTIPQNRPNDGGKFYSHDENPLILVADPDNSLKDVKPEQGDNALEDVKPEQGDNALKDVKPEQGDNALKDVKPEQGDNALKDVKPEQGGGAESSFPKLRSIPQLLEDFPVPQVSAEALCATAYNALTLVVEAVTPVTNAITGRTTYRTDESH